MLLVEICTCNGSKTPASYAARWRLRDHPREKSCALSFRFHKKRKHVTTQGQHGSMLPTWLVRKMPLLCCAILGGRNPLERNGGAGWRTMTHGNWGREELKESQSTFKRASPHNLPGCSWRVVAHAPGGLHSDSTKWLFHAALIAGMVLYWPRKGWVRVTSSTDNLVLGSKILKHLPAEKTEIVWINFHFWHLLTPSEGNISLKGHQICFSCGHALKVISFPPQCANTHTHTGAPQKTGIKRWPNKSKND